MNVHIVMVQPARGGNVGAAARAMKTMGFSILKIVGSTGITEEPEARAFAHGSTDILESAKHYGDLTEALQDIDLAVGTTGRRRGIRRDYYPPDELFHMLRDEQRGASVALVFGSEESGLSNQDLTQCQIVSAIPMRRAYPSLNLGQAVMVYTYALSALVTPVMSPASPEATGASAKALVAKAHRVLPALGFDPGRARYHRMIERIGAAQQTDVNLLHSLLSAIEKQGQSVERFG